jgi:hypothetical protein
MQARRLRDRLNYSAPVRGRHGCDARWVVGSSAGWLTARRPDLRGCGNLAVRQVIRTDRVDRCGLHHVQAEALGFWYEAHRLVQVVRAVADMALV